VAFSYVIGLGGGGGNDKKGGGRTDEKSQKKGEDLVSPGATERLGEHREPPGIIRRERGKAIGEFKRKSSRETKIGDVILHEQGKKREREPGDLTARATLR